MRPCFAPILDEMSYTIRLTTSLCLALILTACSSSSDHPPVALEGNFQLDEDTEFRGFLMAVDAETANLQYSISTPPAHGTVSVDALSGEFTYLPEPDFHGVDSFEFAAFDGKSSSLPATVSINVAPVNDAPVARAVPNLRNSAYTQKTRIRFPIHDVDNDVLSVHLESSDPDVATIEQDGEFLAITPVSRGKSTITISASDGQYSAETSFEFGVDDVTRHAIVRSDALNPGPLALRNTSDRDSTFTLTYNGFEAFATAADAAKHVQGMTPEFPGEPFQRKLWRFVRDNTYHNVPLNADHMWNDMWTTLNSLGWGFCSHVSAVYVEIAKAAGYEARVWGLSGHVVPEILIDGRWEMYDPDLAVYYFDRDGQIAGVEQLAQDPALIVAPSEPILPELALAHAGPYRQAIANLYTTQDNNFVDTGAFAVREPGGSTIVTLPPGSELLLPGRWTDSPTGYDGATPYKITEYRQAKLILPAGWTGKLSMPWVLWQVEGNGTIRIANREYLAGQEKLNTFLKAPKSPVVELEVEANHDGLELVFMINAVRYELLPRNFISITGLDTWAVDMGIKPSVSGLHSEVFPESLRKPGAPSRL